MALQSSGAISMSQINTELGRSSTATVSLDTAENGGYGAINTCGSPFPSGANPASMSEWYSYNHSAVCCSAATGASASNVFTSSFNYPSGEIGGPGEEGGEPGAEGG